MSRITQVIVGLTGVCLIAMGLYAAAFGLNLILGYMATGNIAGVVGIGLIGWFGGGAVIVILLGVGIGLVAVAIDN